MILLSFFIFTTIKFMIEQRLFLLDALSLIYRSYHICRVKNLNISNELSKAITYCFFEMLSNIQKSQKPSHIAVVFDINKPSFRHKLYPKYKAHRKAMPLEIADAIALIKEMLKLVNIQSIELVGFKADDIIGTLAKKALNKKLEVYIVSSDKDFFQLVEDGIYIYKYKKAGKEARIIDITEIRNMYSIKEPLQLIDLFAFVGDKSDNIPGIYGFSKRNVKKLISEYGSIDEIYRNLDKITAKYREMLISREDDIILSKKLITIDTNVPINIEPSNLQVKEFDLKGLKNKIYLS